MPGETPSLENINAAVDALLQPLRDQLAVVDAELETLETRKTELREVRARINRLIGSNAPKAKPKQHVKRQSSEESINALHEWLTTHVNGETFYVRQLIEREDWNGLMSDSYASKCMKDLHERGVVRLVSKRVPGKRGSVYVYQLTNART